MNDEELIEDEREAVAILEAVGGPHDHDTAVRLIIESRDE